MANHTHHDGKVLGWGSEVWGWLSFLAIVGFLVAGNCFSGLMRTGRGGFGLLLIAATFFLFLAALGGWILALIRGGQAEKEREGRKEIQKLLSSPNPPAKLTANPQLYRQAQAELQARKEDALKMQQLHALRQQVEEEERKAGIFDPTLSPTRPRSGSNHSQQADPMTAQMAQLTQRRIEAERQKHLMKSLRVVEDAEWEADDV